MPNPTTLQRGQHRISFLAVTLCSIAALPLFAEPTETKRDPLPQESTSRPAKNPMRGIVVRKGTGKPLADVLVTIARVHDGEIGVGATSYFSTDELFGEKKRAMATTGKDGNFLLNGISTPDELYTLVATNRTAGASLIRKLRPSDYHEKPLRVEIDDPSFVRVWKSPNVNGRSEISAHVELKDSRVVPRQEGARDSAKLTLMDPCVWDVVGPLLPGLEYDVSKSISTPTNAYYWATIYKHRFTAEAGQTLDLSDWPELGTTLDGRLHATDGTPLSNVNVMVKIDGSEFEIMGTLSDNLGRYEITGLPPGRHTLELSRQGRRLNRFDMTPPKDISWSHEIAWEAGTNRVTRDVNDLEIIKRSEKRRK